LHSALRIYKIRSALNLFWFPKIGYIAFLLFKDCFFADFTALDAGNSGLLPNLEQKKITKLRINECRASLLEFAECRQLQ
jgi:hypothetical protein